MDIHVQLPGTKPEQFRLKFFHDHFDPPLPAYQCSASLRGSTPIQASTCCQIYKVRNTETPESTTELLASGYSFCHAHDEFRKPVGRKIALTNALQALTETLGMSNDYIAYCVRKAFWDQYHQYTRGTTRKSSGDETHA